MKKNILAFLLLLGYAVSQAQVGIGVANPDASAVFEVASTTKGLLPPRLTTGQRTAIVSPVAGLMVYNTDNKIFEWYDGAVWQGVEVKSNKSATVTLGSSDIFYPTQNAVKTYVDAQVSSATPDATTLAKGKIQLAGDLAGTAALPKIVGINGIALSGLTTGLLKNTTGTGIPVIATVRTDYAEPTTALGTGILKNTTATGAHTIAVAADFPVLNQNTTGNAATVTTNANLTGDVTSTGNATTIAAKSVTAAKLSPTTAGAAGQVLSIDGATNLVWANATAATTASNGLTATSGNVTLGGTLSAATTITGATFPLAITSTASNGFSIDGTTFSVDASSAKHYVGIGTATPLSKLEVNGAATNSAPVPVTINTIDFSLNNLASTSVVATAFTLNGLKNGGAYTLVASATTNTGSAGFVATGFTINYMSTVAMTSGKQHIYSFIVLNNQVYVSMATQN